MPKFFAVVVACILLGGGYLYVQKDNEDGPMWNPFRSGTTTQEVVVPATEASKKVDVMVASDDSAITNFDECIAAGFKPLADAPDKCLTSGGHLYIKDVVE